LSGKNGEDLKFEVKMDNNKVEAKEDVKKEDITATDLVKVFEEETVFAENLSNSVEENGLVSGSNHKKLYFHSDFSFLESDEEVKSTKDTFLKLIFKTIFISFF